MSEGWQRFDFEGGGLQAANRRIVARLRRRGRAYALWLAFPLGLHRDYLDAHGSAWCWRIAGVVEAAVIWSDSYWSALALGAAMLAVALYDLYWIDRRVTALNKALRKDAFLSKSTPGAPTGFRGRVADDPDDASATAAPTGAPVGTKARVPSFAEQENLLREIAASRRHEPSPSQE